MTVAVRKPARRNRSLSLTGQQQRKSQRFPEVTEKIEVLERRRYKLRYKKRIKVVALTRNKSGEYVARKVIPKDVRSTYTQLYGVGWEARLTLPSNLTNAEANARHGAWLAEIETRIAAIRAAAKGEGQPLTQKQAQALAGRWYGWFTGQYEANPGDPNHWHRLHDTLIWDVIYPLAPEKYLKNPKADPTWEWARAPEVREAIRPLVAQEARVGSFLAAEGIKLNADAYALFVDAVADNLPHALMLLERWAAGDYAPDDTPHSFPAYLPPQQSDDGGMDPWQLWETFVLASSLADGTVDRWRGVFRKLKADFPGRSAGTITSDEAAEWIKKQVGDERSAATVRAVWITATRRVFAWAVKNRHIAANPFAEVAVEKPKRITKRPKWFTQDEIAHVLNATMEYAKTQTTTARVRRWVPWICAYSGARAGEITQLRGSDVGEHEGVLAIRLTPDAGPIKTGEARWVPIHEHLVSQGFIKFVAECGEGPLFYDPPKVARARDKLNPRRTPAQTARNELAKWTRELLGISDRSLSPTHAWRHTFQRVADVAGIPEKISDAITGHAPANVARTYAIPTLDAMADALKLFPRYKLDLSSSTTGHGRVSTVGEVQA
jgi:integrase